MKKTILVVALLGAALVGFAQERLADYDQARKFTSTKLGTMLFTCVVDPHWTPKGDQFWYYYKTTQGGQWYLVDPIAKKRTPLFDCAALAAELTEIVKDPFVADHLSLNDLKAEEDGTFSFNVKSKQKKTFYFSYDPSTGKLTHLKEKKQAEKYPRWATSSPDGETVVYAKDCNLWKMSRADYEKAKRNEKDTTIVETQLTTWGVEHFGFGIPYSTLNTDTLCNGKRRSCAGLWSPDSKHFAVLATDQRHVKELWVINALATPRPTLESYKYHMPGEKEAPQTYLKLIDMTNDTHQRIHTECYLDQELSLARRPTQKRNRDRKEIAKVWMGDNTQFFLRRYSRGWHNVDVCKYVLGQDTITPLIHEEANEFVESRTLVALADGKELIQWSERNGWAHLYLYDSEGNLKNAITAGEFHVEQVVKVDERARVVYFTAMGRKDAGLDDADWHPYYQHLYRVNLDGSGLKRLTQGNFFHNVTMDDDCRYFIDNYSRVDAIPRTAVFDNRGQQLLALEVSDFSNLLAAGYKFPEVFKVKAADGVTDLYGVMYKPFNFDPNRKYPIIDYVYPGPQSEATYYPFTRMIVRTDRLAQAGFIVITVGHRGGHPNRSRWYHSYGYGNFRDYALADHKAAVEQLANRHDFIDINRVGIHGHSGGGFMSTAALFQYPDFYKAAVSAAGNHDNYIFNSGWTEIYNGIKEEITAAGDTTFIYKIETNPTIAQQVKGHLLLVHGDVDNNVHPGHTTRVANALIRAGKRFDMLFLPNQPPWFDSGIEEFFYWRMVAHFSEYLKGEKETTVSIPEIK